MTVQYTMIRRAATADIPLIRRRLSELEHPPYYPEDEDIQALMEDEVFLVWEEVGAISNWLREDGIKTIRGRYVLPESLTTKQMVVLLRESWRECARRWPDALDWRLDGTFQTDNEVKCRAWRRALRRGGVGPVVDTREDGATCVAWVLGPALARVEELSASD